jgi:23S rRNA (pseudouridine1915-N3)-methyltransferase
VAKLVLVAHGAKLRGWAQEARDEYLRRMPRGYAVECLPRAPKGARRVALDQRGRDQSTAQLAAQLGAGCASRFPPRGQRPRRTDMNQRDAVLLLRLSALTLPHALAQVVLAEQLYRAATLLTGHPYHRE